MLRKSQNFRELHVLSIIELKNSPLDNTEDIIDQLPLAKILTTKLVLPLVSQL